MSYQYNLWMQARLASPDWTKAVGDAFLFHQIQILQDFFEQEGDCGKGGGGGGRGGPKNPAQYGMRLPKRDVDELWREFKKKKDLGKVKEPVAAKLHALSSSPPPVQPPDATKSSIIKCQEQVNRWPTVSSVNLFFPFFSSSLFRTTPNTQYADPLVFLFFFSFYPLENLERAYVDQLYATILSLLLFLSILSRFVGSPEPATPSSPSRHYPRT